MLPSRHRSRPRLALLTAALLLLPVAAGSASAAGQAPAASAAACPPGWRLVQSPSPGNVSNTFADVSVQSATEALAVGTMNSEIGPLFATRPAAFRFSHGTWTALPTETGMFAQFAGVYVAAPNDAWAVGANVPDPLSPFPLAEHFDGASWTVVPTPSLAQANLVDVDGTGSDDVWAVGVAHGFAPHMLALHWDGAAWRLVKTPTLPSAFADLDSVVAIAPDDVWAVGYYLASDFNDAPFAVHWDGSRWTLSLLPKPPAGGAELYDVTAVSSSNVWAVGRIVRGPGFRPFAVHWDGAAWHLDSPGTGTDAQLFGVTRMAGGAVLAVGNRRDSQGRYRAFTAMLRHGTWRALPTPSTAGNDTLFEVGSDPAGLHAVAVGNSQPHGVGTSLVESFCA